MKQFAVRFVAVAVLATAAVIFSGGVSSTAANNAADDPTVKEIMKLANGKMGLCPEIGTGLKLDTPDWKSLNAKAKELVPLAKAMAKNKPPIGSEESWKRLTAAYEKSAEDLVKATDDKDADKAKAAMKGLTACGPCHMAHRVKKK
jgi:cytochrome c556